jgi:hypothetical protein
MDCPKRPWAKVFPTTRDTSSFMLVYVAIGLCEGRISGHADQWLNMKNPLAPAVRREREIDWAKR